MVAATHAEQVTQSIANKHWHAELLPDLAMALAVVGDYDRAEELAWSARPELQARALTDVADAAEPAKARLLIAEALAVGQWTTPLQTLAQVDSTALATFVDECASHQPSR